MQPKALKTSKARAPRLKSSITPEASSESRADLMRRASSGELDWSSAIRQMRLSLGKTQEEFGILFGLTRIKVNNLEAGRANPTTETLERVGRAFGLSVGFVPRADRVPKRGDRG